MTRFGPTGVDEALDDSKHVVELSVDLDVVDLHRGVDAASQPVGDASQESGEAALGLHLRPADVPGPRGKHDSR